MVRWARHADTMEFFPALAALVKKVENIIFLTAHCSGSRAGWPVSVSQGWGHGVRAMKQGHFHPWPPVN